MNRNLLFRLSVLIAAPLILITLIGSLLIYTQSGTQWLFAALQKRELISYQNLNGTIAKGIQIGHLQIKTAESSVNLKTMEAAISLPHLLQGELRIDRIASREVIVTLKPQQKETPQNELAFKEFLILDQPLLPVKLSLRALAFKKLKLKTSKDSYELTDIKLRSLIDQRSIRNFELSLNHPKGRLKAKGFADLGHHLRTRLNLEWSLNLSKEEMIQGHTELSGNRKLLVIDQQTTGDLTSVVQLKIHDGLKKPKLALEGQLVSLQLPSLSAIQVSGAQFQLKGNTEQFKGWINGKLLFPHQSSMKFNLQGAFGQQRARIRHLSLTTEAGTADFTGTLDWQEGEKRWQGVATSEAFATNLFHPLLPEQVNGSIKLSGSMSDQLRLDISSKGLGGQLRGQPFDAALSGHWQDQTLFLEQLNATMGGSEISLSGIIGADNIDTRFSLDAPDLTLLMPGITGSITMKGELSGTPDQPDIQAIGEGAGLSYSGLTVAGMSFALNTKQGVFMAGNNHINISNIQHPALHLESVMLSAQGRWKHPQISVISRNKQASLNLSGDAHFAAKQVSGAIKELQIDVEHYGQWQLDKPADFNYHQVDDWSLNSLCLTEKTSHLCGWGKAQNNRLKMAVTGSELPLSLLDMVVPLPVTFKGRLDIDTLIESSNGHLAGYGNFSQGPTGEPLLLFIDASKTPLSLNDVKIGVTLKNQQLTSQLSASLTGNGQLKGQLSMDNLHTSDGSINASLNYDIPDLTPYTDISPSLGFTSGKLKGSLAVGGTRTHPEISTDTELNIPKLLILPLSIEWQDLVATVKTNPHQKTRIEASVRAGEGLLQMNGDLSGRSANDWTADLALTGNDVLLIDQPDRRLVTNPNLKIHATQTGIHIDGQLHIPEAKLQIKPSPKKLAITQDARIHTDSLDNQAPKLSASATAEVILGDQVHFEAYGLKTGVTGRMLLIRKPHGPLLGEGELELINGNYKAYGQDLKIDYGKVLFSGSIMRPTLDVKAQRVIGPVTAGLQVTGPVDNLRSRLFSSPALSDSEALSYIIRGKPLNSSSSADKSLFSNVALSYAIGQSTPISTKLAQMTGLDELGIDAEQGIETLGFSLGKHLTPNLYVRYGIGVVDKINRLFMQYQISEKLFLQSELGEGQSIDLIYRVK